MLSLVMAAGWLRPGVIRNVGHGKSRRGRTCLNVENSAKHFDRGRARQKHCSIGEPADENARSRACCENPRGRKASTPSGSGRRVAERRKTRFTAGHKFSKERVWSNKAFGRGHGFTMGKRVSAFFDLPSLLNGVRLLFFFPPFT